MKGATTNGPNKLPERPHAQDHDSSSHLANLSTLLYSLKPKSASRLKEIRERACFISNATTYSPNKLVVSQREIHMFLLELEVMIIELTTSEVVTVAVGVGGVVPLFCGLAGVAVAYWLQFSSSRTGCWWQQVARVQFTVLPRTYGSTT